MTDSTSDPKCGGGENCAASTHYATCPKFSLTIPLTLRRRPRNDEETTDQDKTIEDTPQTD